MIWLEAISHQYPNGMQALDGVNLNISAGETITLIGRSGCGKSTLLKTINGLVRPNDGLIYIDGNALDYHDLVRQRRQIGYVIQHVGLFPHLTVSENIGLIAKLEGWSQDRIIHRRDELLELAGLTPQRICPKYPTQLSGGEAQRVGIARALMLDPPILLMDEPFGALDPIIRNQLQQEFKSLEAGIHKTIVFVTHDVHEAFYLGDRVALMDHGKLVQCGTPEEIQHAPASAFVSEFIQGLEGRKTA